MTSSLYTLTEEQITLHALLESGEIDEQTYQDTLDAYLNGATAEKLEGYCKLIRMKERQAESIETEKKLLADRQKAVESQASRLRDRLKWHLETLGKDKADAGIFSLAIQRNGGKQAVRLIEGLEAESLPEPFKKTVTTVVVDSEAVRTALEDGESLAFAELLPRGTRLVIK